jgi:hypothetical protein
MNIYIESGAKKVFACAVDWPGWSRSGRDEKSALKTLFDYRLRYAKVMYEAVNEFQVPGDSSGFVVIARYKGNATTDFGSPGVVPDTDQGPLEVMEFIQNQKILLACWKVLGQAAQTAAGRDLRKGPRGGGRDLEEILAHVGGAAQAYLTRIGWKNNTQDGDAGNGRDDTLENQIIKATEAAFQGLLPESGPKGGKYWPLRYFFRRSAWHVLDHAWEIEDRLI